MPRYWLKALGSAGEPMPDDWRSVGPDLFERVVTFPKRPSIEPGDRIVLYAAGSGAFFALGTVDSYPYEYAGEISEERFPWRVDFRVDHSVPRIHKGIPLHRLSVGERDVPSAMRRRSHIRLKDEEFAAAEGLLVDREESLTGDG